MNKHESASSRCATCDVELTPRRRASGFCCGGCERGGPCTCSYDDPPASRIPMSDTTYAALQQDIARVGMHLEQLGPDAYAHAREGLAHGEYFLAVRRQQTLRSILDRAVITSMMDGAALGSRIRYREGDAGAETITLVTPAAAEPLAGRISVTSPIGSAILGRRVGEVVSVRTPGGVRMVTIAAID